MTYDQKQRLLAFLTDAEGKPYYTGQLDGAWGPASEDAAERFLADFSDEKEDVWNGIQYFTPREFACRCGKCGGFPVQPDRVLLELADELRQQFGAPMVVSSGIRCSAHNEAVGGVEKSRHLLGKAMDFCVPGKTAGELLAAVCSKQQVRYAYDIDGTYVHMDVE